MSKPEWTPGPWYVAGQTVVRQTPEAWGIVAACYHPIWAKVQWRANANLIAAAPDLYDALGGLFDALVDAFGEESIDKHGALLAAVDVAYAARRKARGDADA